MRGWACKKGVEVNALSLVSGKDKSDSRFSDILFFAAFLRSECLPRKNPNVHIRLHGPKVIKHHSMPIKACEELRQIYAKLSRDTVFAFLYPVDKSRSLSFADFVLCIWKCFGADQNLRKRDGYCFVWGCFEASGCLHSKMKQRCLLSFLAKIL